MIVSGRRRCAVCQHMHPYGRWNEQPMGASLPLLLQAIVTQLLRVVTPVGASAPHCSKTLQITLKRFWNFYQLFRPTIPSSLFIVLSLSETYLRENVFSVRKIKQISFGIYEKKMLITSLM